MIREKERSKTWTGRKKKAGQKQAEDRGRREVTERNGDFRHNLHAILHNR